MKRKVNKRRRREGKTDYKARLRLLRSNLPRIVIRKSNKYFVIQYVKSENAQDTVVCEVRSKELLKYGWPEQSKGSLKSIPACYLIGLILGEKIKEKDEKGKVILDLGLQRNIQKSRVYAVLKGLVDSDIEISHKKEIFPDEKRIMGEHLKNKVDVQEIKKKLLEKVSSKTAKAEGEK